MRENLLSVIERYYRAWFGVNEVYARWARRHGLTANALMVLYVIYHTENCSQQNICTMLMLPKQTVNSILNGFEKLGYVSRQTNNADRRNKAIVFSCEGRAYAEAILAELQQAESDALGAMSPGQINGLIAGTEIYLERFTKTTDQ